MSTRMVCLSIAVLAALSVSAQTPAQAGTKTLANKTMSFEACLATIRRTAAQLGVAPVNIVETNQVRIVRFKTVDGSILVSCSRADRKMVITQSD